MWRVKGCYSLILWPCVYISILLIVYLNSWLYPYSIIMLHRVLYSVHHHISNILQVLVHALIHLLQFYLCIISITRSFYRKRYILYNKYSTVYMSCHLFRELLGFNFVNFNQFCVFSWILIHLSLTLITNFSASCKGFLLNWESGKSLILSCNFLLSKWFCLTCSLRKSDISWKL